MTFLFIQPSCITTNSSVASGTLGMWDYHIAANPEGKFGAEWYCSNVVHIDPRCRQSTEDRCSTHYSYYQHSRKLLGDDYVRNLLCADGLSLEVQRRRQLHLMAPENEVGLPFSRPGDPNEADFGFVSGSLVWHYDNVQRAKHGFSFQRPQLPELRLALESLAADFSDEHEEYLAQNPKISIAELQKHVSNKKRHQYCKLIKVKAQLVHSVYFFCSRISFMRKSCKSTSRP